MILGLRIEWILWILSIVGTVALSVWGIWLRKRVPNNYIPHALGFASIFVLTWIFGVSFLKDILLGGKYSEFSRLTYFIWNSWLFMIFFAWLCDLLAEKSCEKEGYIERKSK